MGQMTQMELLIEILLDPDAGISTRDDAASYLSEYDDPRAEEALLRAAHLPGQHKLVIASCGESISEIWLRNDRFDLETFSKLPPVALREAKALIRGNRPEWLRYTDG